MAILVYSISEQRLPPITVRLSARTVQSVGWLYHKSALFYCVGGNCDPLYQHSKYVLRTQRRTGSIRP
jgi:hypothetical protein